VSRGARDALSLPRGGEARWTWPSSMFKVVGSPRSLFNREVRAAGWHEVPMRAESLPGGSYFLRLQVSSTEPVQKFVLLSQLGLAKSEGRDDRRFWKNVRYYSLSDCFPLRARSRVRVSQKLT
jgi:hypothetical protein